MAYRDNHHIIMPYLSKEGLEMETILKSLSDEYRYKKLPKEKSIEQKRNLINIILKTLNKINFELYHKT